MNSFWACQPHHLIDQRFQTQADHQGRRDQQPSVGDQVQVVARRRGRGRRTTAPAIAAPAAAMDAIDRLLTALPTEVLRAIQTPRRGRRGARCPRGSTSCTTAPPRRCCGSPSPRTRRGATTPQASYSALPHLPRRHSRALSAKSRLGQTGRRNSCRHRSACPRQCRTERVRSVRITYKRQLRRPRRSYGVAASSFRRRRSRPRACLGPPYRHRLRPHARHLSAGT